MELTKKNYLDISIENYSGPLEVLLDLAKSQKVDLANISITQLADQFIDFITNTKKINLDIASEYLLMATWLAYLKSKLLLPEDEDEDFKASEVAEKLKMQLKKLELIRLFSDQLLKKKRLGVDIYMRGMSGGIRTKKNSKYSVTLYELLKSYSNHIMKKNFLSIQIAKLPVCTTEEGIKIIKANIKRINKWIHYPELIPEKFKTSSLLKKSALCGLFSASLELTKEGLISMMQKKSFDKILIKEKK
jgi:segregation and condensation protein A